MEKDITNGDMIRKWLEGELSQEEMDAIKTSDAYNDYKKIIDATNALNAPEYDIEKEYFKIQSLKSSKKSPVKHLKKWMYSAAAILLITLGYFYFSNQTTHYQTGFGEQLSVTLPDNSKVRLNANSTIEFNEHDWSSEREVRLKGEGFFDVESGSKFLVKTSQGKVEVLGTKFNVAVHQDFFEVTCFEGKVKATDIKQNHTILTQGKGYRNANGKIQKWDFSDRKASWSKDESNFNNTPIKYVLIAFQNQYNVTFENKNVDENQRFTGSFTHNKIDTALETLFDAMEISYTFEGERKIVLFKSE